MRALFALFVRSLRDDTRARLPILLRATLVAIILLTVWENQRDFTRRAAPGREFLFMVVMVNLAFVAIAAIGSFPAAITEEKEDETLPLLRMTGLSPLAILFGKSTTQLIGALLLLAVQIPFTVLAVTLGGVSIGQVLNMYAVLGATTFFLCNLALLGSVLCRTTIRAGIFTACVGGILFGFLPLVISTTPSANIPQTAWEHVSIWVLEAHPIYSLATLLESRLTSYNIQRQILPNLGAGLLCFLLSWLLFDRFCSVTTESVGRRRRSKITQSLHRVSGRGRPSPIHALAWKDLNFLVGGRRAILIRCALCGLIFLSCAVYQKSEWPHSDYFWARLGEITMNFAAIGFGLELSMLAARIFGTERQALTLSGLAGLPRTTGWLIRQKLLGCLPVLAPSAFLFGVGLTIRLDRVGTAYWRSEDWIGLIYIFAQALLLPLVITYLSLRIRRGALPAGIAIIAVLNAFTMVLGGSIAPFENDIFIGVTAGLCLIASAFIAVRVYREIPRAAAAD